MEMYSSASANCAAAPARGPEFVPEHNEMHIETALGAHAGTDRRASHTTDNATYMNTPVAAFMQDYEAHDEGFVEELIDGFEATEHSSEVHGGKKLQRLCDIINKIASRGESLEFDRASHVFRVLDGQQFEQDFLSLKITKTLKESGRVFAQMYRTYTITSGERWAADGTTFVAKSAKTPLPTLVSKAEVVPAMSPDGLGAAPSWASASPDSSRQYQTSPQKSPITSADRSTSCEAGVLAKGWRSDSVSMTGSVHVLVKDSEGRENTCTLQQFIDVTGLGAMYKAATTSRKRAREEFGNYAGTQEHDADLWWSSEGSAARAEPLRQAQVPEVMGGLWGATSKGDQAYFFKRRDGVGRFENGAIVGLVGGVLVDSGTVKHSGGKGVYMVVSDLNAKWKGEPIPVTAAEEEKGHWCCFLGQVPVTVRGPVKTGECIGPASDGGGHGRVAVMGRDPVVGIALAEKSSDEPGIVKTLCFAGLNALSQQDAATDALLEKAVRLEQRVEEIHIKTDDIEAVNDKNRRRISSMQRAVNSIYRSKKLQLRISAVILVVLLAVGTTVGLLLSRGGSESTAGPPGLIPCTGLECDLCGEGAHSCAADQDCVNVDFGNACVCKSGYLKGCSEGWTWFGDQCYKILPSKSPYLSAATACAAEGAKLPVIASKAENDFVQSLACAVKDEACQIWLGMELLGGTWRWRDGTEVVVPEGVVFSYDGESHARMVTESSGAQWQDMAPEQVYLVVCERSATEGDECGETDECASGTHACSAHAACYNTRGSYSCACNDGFTGDGVTCADIDECATNNITVAALQWRVTNLGSIGSRPGVSELKMFSDAAGTTELVSFEEVISSGYHEPLGIYASAEAAVDGDTDNRWRPHTDTPAAGEVWIGFRFRTPTTVQQARAVGLGVGSGDGASWNGGVALQYSNDGVEWRTASSQINSDTTTFDGRVAVEPCGLNATCTNTLGSYRCVDWHECPGGWTQKGPDCYKLLELRAPYFEASAACAAEGAALPVIASQAENEFVRTLACGNLSIEDEADCHIWLGMERPDGTWRWRDGREVEVPEGVFFTFDDEVYARIAPAMEVADWEDQPPASQSVVLCEVKLAGVPELVDECVTGVHACSVHARCADTDPSYSCTCNDGYAGDGVTCDFDECASGTHACSAHAACYNTRGSYSCACNDGFTGGGVTCADIDECATDNITVAALQWRVTNLGSIGSRPGVSELKMFSDAAGTTELVSFEEVISSGYHEPLGIYASAEAAVDGDTDNRWRPHTDTPAAGEVWIGFRFRTPTTVQQARAVGLGVGSGDGASWNGGVALQYSNDGVEWRTASSQINSDTTTFDGRVAVEPCGLNATCTNTLGSYRCVDWHECPGGWTQKGPDCYKLLELRAPYFEASAACAAEGAALPVIASQAENEFVRTLACGNLSIEDEADCHIWLGMERPDGTWRWRDGREVEVPEGVFFTFDDEVYARIAPAMEVADWEDQPPASQSVVLCEVKLAGVPELFNECFFGAHACSVHAGCADTDLSYSCTCNDGYAGDGVTCADVDECASGTHACSAHAACYNTRGSYSCACNDGFTGDGVTCADIDECATDNITVAALQWRVTNLGSIGSRPGVSELKMFSDAAGTTELVSFEEVISSGYHEPLGINASAEAAVDGDTDNRWRPHTDTPAAGEVWIGFRFRTPTTVQQARAVGLGVGSGIGAGWNGGVALQYSNDGVEWKTASSQINSDTTTFDGRVAVASCSDTQACVNALGSFSCQLQCAEGWTQFESECYKLISNGAWYFEAFAACAAEGAALPIITSKAENNFVRSLACPDGECHTWLGMIRQDGRWLWRDGTEVTVPEDMVFTFQGEYRARLLPALHSSDWDDQLLSHQYRVVCEKALPNMDECASGTHACSAHAACYNTRGSYSCACNDGFTGDGVTCADVDECATDNITVAALQWRVTNLGSIGSRPGVSELKMFSDAAGTTELVSFEEVISSGYHEPLGIYASAEAAVDGDTDNRWRPHTDTPVAGQVWIGFRFRTPTTVQQARAVGLGVGSGDGASWNGGVALQYSNDGVEWRTASSQINSDTTTFDGRVAVGQCKDHTRCSNTVGSFACECDEDFGAECADGWVRFGDQCYRRMDFRANIYEAADLCAAQGAALPIIESQEENWFVHSLHCPAADDDGSCNVWLGLVRPFGTEGEWLWWDGTRVAVPDGLLFTYQAERYARMIPAHPSDWEDTWAVDDFLVVCERPLLEEERCAPVDTDEDECASGTHACSAHAACYNTRGSYSCACNDGFTGDGVTCADIDECATDNITVAALQWRVTNLGYSIRRPGVSELKMFSDAAGTIELVSFEEVISSGYYNPFANASAESAVDDDPESKWWPLPYSPEAGQVWIGFRFRTPTTVKHVRAVPFGVGWSDLENRGWNGGVALQYSNDGVEWRTAAEQHEANTATFDGLVAVESCSAGETCANTIGGFSCT